MEDNTVTKRPKVDMDPLGHSELYEKKYGTKIPVLSNEEFNARLLKTTPIRADKHHNLFILEPPQSALHESYICSPPVKYLATRHGSGAFVYKNMRDFENRTGSVNFILCGVTFITLHTYGYYGFFKPSLGEVISQLPKDLYENFDEIFVTTDMISSEINTLMLGNYHIGKTTVFLPSGRKLDPSDVPEYIGQIKPCKDE